MFKPTKNDRKQLRTAIRDLDTEIRPLSDADLRLVSGGGSAGMTSGTAQTDDIPTVDEC